MQTFAYVHDQTQRQKDNKIKLIINILTCIINEEVHEAEFILNLILTKLEKQKKIHM